MQNTSLIVWAMVSRTCYTHASNNKWTRIGIGLEVHEAPYLRGGSLDVIQTGHTFSDEPGVYMEGKVSRLSFSLLH